MNLQYAIVPIGQHLGVANVFASEVEEDRLSWALYFVDDDSKRRERRDFIGHVWKKWATLELCEAYYDDAARQGQYPVFGIRYYMHSWPVRLGVAEVAGSVGR